VITRSCFKSMPAETDDAPRARAQKAAESTCLHALSGPSPPTSAERRGPVAAAIAARRRSSSDLPEQWIRTKAP